MRRACTSEAFRSCSSGATANVSKALPGSSAAHHVLDAAHLFRLALEKAPAGSVLHGVAEEGVPIRAIAEVIGRHLNLPIVTVPVDAAGEHFGWLAHFLAADVPTSSALTRELLSWQSTHLGLIDDLDQGHYFHTPST